MAKKRHYMQRKPSRRKPDQPQGSPPDRRAMEKTMSDLRKLLRNKEFESIDEVNAYMQGIMESGEIPSVPNQTPVEEAQDIMYEAWDSHGARRVRLARRALKVSPDCADAYVLLAEETAKSLEEAKELYEQGVAAGERALGPEGFEENAGHFWGVIETRPYMRARAGLAMCLLQLGEHQQAIAHYEDLLRLNPGDNQGIRYVLAPLYLEANADIRIASMLEHFEDDISAAWLYTRALWMFRLEGASEVATRYLKTAIRQNSFVPPYILGTKRLPPRSPDYIGRGDDDEAVAYALMWKHQWTGNPAALNWLRETVTSV